MGIGTAKSELTLSVPPLQAFARVVAAMDSIGDIKERDDDDLFLRGTTRYGLQLIRLKVKIVPEETGALVTVRALGDDIWGKGAREGCRRFLNAMGSA